jgi:signal transduction histidine kinase
LGEPFLLRLAVLLLTTLCCYGAQALLERQRLAAEEAEEFAAREGQLHSAGRLAAEFAHQIKNPLAVINNAAFRCNARCATAKPNPPRSRSKSSRRRSRAPTGHHANHGLRAIERRPRRKTGRHRGNQPRHRAGVSPAVPTGSKLKKNSAGHFRRC